MVGGSSVFALSALAVDREIVGKDSEGKLIPGEGEAKKVCCWAAAAARRADVAVWTSALDFGEVEKNWTNLFAREVDGRRDSSFFSSKVGEVVAGQVLAKMFIGLRGIAEQGFQQLVEVIRDVTIRVNSRYEECWIMEVGIRSY